MAFDSFYRILRLMSDIDLSAKSGVFCLLDRAAVEPLKSMMEHNRYLPGLRRWVGFRQGVVFYDRDERRASHSKQGLARLTRYALDAIFSFSYKPLRVASYTGVLVWVLTGLYALLLVVTRLLQINVVPGFTTTVVAVLLIGGLQLLCLGVLGEYLARVYDEVKRRPLYIEREFIGSDPQPEPAEASKPRSSGR
jgi:dolichol-phosphate mannosyltransferase